MNYSTPGLPVPHHLPEFARVHVHCIGDALQPSQPLTSSSPSALDLSQHQGLFQWVVFSHQMIKIMEFQLQQQSFQWIFISLKIDWFDLLAVQGTFRSLLQQHSSKASTLQCSAFFTVQLSQPYMTTGKTRALTIWTFADRIISLLFNTLCLSLLYCQEAISSDFTAAVTIHSDFRAQEEEICHDFHLSPSICHEVMGSDALILVFFFFFF